MLPTSSLIFTQQYQTKAEYAAEQIHNAILSGIYPAGSRLLIDDISRTYNISAIPVREALHRLEALALVEIHSYRGIYVKELTYEEFEDSFGTRMILECIALEKAAKIFTTENIKLAQQLLDRYVSLLKSDLSLEAREVHKELHFSLYRAAHSPLLLKAIDLVWRNSERYRFFAGKFQTADAAIIEHQLIIDACGKQKPKIARMALTDHIRNAVGRISKNLKNSGISKTNVLKAINSAKHCKTGG